VSVNKKSRIRQLMPLVDQIKDKKLRKGVLDVWVKAWEESEWEDLADCPFSVALKVKLEECSLIQHTNCVTATALAMAANTRDILGIPVNDDLVLAGALLHDVCKVVENAPEFKHSTIGKNLVHGMYGVHLALNAGLPIEIAHIISSHTPQVSQVPNIVEGILLSYADMAAVDPILLRKGAPLFYKRH
jgi:putative nucleotidyltransferase with HDIG domain